MHRDENLDVFSLDFTAFLLYNDKNKEINEMTKEKQQETDLPSGLAAPAQRALAAAGITRLEQLSQISEADLLKLHGIGPNAVKKLRHAMNTKNLSFALSKPGK